MHQPIVEPTPFRRSSFGIESTLRTAAPVMSDAARVFQEILSRPDRPAPSRRSSLRAAPQPFVPPPPPPLVSMAAQVVDPTTLAAMLESKPQAATMRPPSPSSHRNHLSTRSPPTSSSRRNSSQAEHFLRSNPGLGLPSSAGRRAYSFVRDHSLRPPAVGEQIAPERTSSCPPDSDMLKTRAVRSNSDGYTSASTSFMTEYSTSPTSSISSQPSDSEEGLGQLHSSHDKKAPKSYVPSFNLELESRRLDLLWRETGKLWKDKHGNTLPRAEDMAFRQKVEGGHGQAEDSSPESEWRELWKSTNSSWGEFEARWRQDDVQKRATSRNDDGHFHTAHSESRDMTSTDEDKTMSAILAGFEHRMNEKRRVQALKRAEEEQKRRDQERGGWPGTLGQTAEHEPVHRSHDRLLRPDVTRTRSSSVVVEGRPTFQRARSGSIAAPTDVPLSNPVVDVPPFETAPRFAEKPVRAKRSRPSHGSRESFDLLSPNEEDLQRPTPVEQQRANELKQTYLSQARSTLRWEETQTAGDTHHEDAPRPDKPRRREHERRSRELPIGAGIDPHRIREEVPHQREVSTPNGGSAEVHLPRVKSAERVAQSAETSSGSLEEEVLKLEREQAALARRIQELRAAAEAAANANANANVNPGPKFTQPEPDRGREREQKPKAAKVEARKQQNNEGDVFKAMQERLRKAEEHKPGDFARKTKRPATMPVLDQDTPIASPVARPTQIGDSEGAESRVHFASDTPSAEPVRPSIPRVRTPGPKIPTPPRARTPSPRSQSPVGRTSPSSIGSSNATRDTSPGHEAASSILEAVAPESAAKLQPTPTAHSAPRPPAGRQRDSGSSFIPNPERPKSAAATLGLSVPPHVNTSTSPADANHEQEPSPMNVKTPRASGFDPERTPRAPVCPVLEPSSQPDLSPPPRVYVSPYQARARAEEEISKRRADEEVPKRRVDEDASKRRVDVAVGATVAAAAAEAFDRAGGKKRSKEAELQAQEERRVAEELLAKERRRQEDERRARERAEEARLREAAEKRDREERARIERERRERQEQEERKRRWAEPQYERARPPARSEPSLIDAWNSYELRWSALSVASSTQPIAFRNIPWPLMHIPSGPESFTPQAIGAFLLSPLHSQDKSRKERLRNAMLRWHSDKFEGRWMARVDESERAKVKEAVGAVARALTELMTKSDLY